MNYKMFRDFIFTIEKREARIAELEAALKDMAKYIWRDDYQKLEPTTRAALGDKK